MFGSMMKLPCQQKRISSAAAGAIVAYTGLDRMIPQLPPAAHHALAGVAIDVMCRSRDVLNPDMEYVYSAAFGYAGAIAAGYLLGK